MRSRTRVRAERDATGCTRLVDLAAEAPISARATPAAVYLVASAAGPLPGDDVEVEIVVGPGARLTVATNAATVALGAAPAREPREHADASRTTVRVTVAPDATFEWLAEPLVVTGRADHVQTAEIEAAATSTVRWRDEVVFGRMGEIPGRLRTDLAISVDGRSLIRHALDTHRPGSFATAVLDDARALGTLALVDPALADLDVDRPELPGRAAWFALDGPGAVVTALGPAPDVRCAIDRALAHARTVGARPPRTAPTPALARLAP